MTMNNIEMKRQIGRMANDIAALKKDVDFLKRQNYTKDDIEPRRKKFTEKDREFFT